MTGETLLSILKVTSEGLTAAFGIFGLLTEFKDEKTKQIKKNGKIALCGIIISFIVSGAITALENANARAAERAHANEIRRLSRPLGLMKLQVDYSVDTRAHGSTSNNLKQILGWTVGHEMQGGVADASFPPSLRPKLPSQGLLSAEIGIEIYAKAFPCPTVAPLDRDPDLLVESAKSAVGWQYFADGSTLLATKSFDGVIVKDRGLTTSVEDIPESTVMVWSDAFDDPHVQFQSLDLDVGSGGSKFRLTGAQEHAIKTENNRLGYCYTKPPVWPPLSPDHRAATVFLGQP